jgi:hypothetical protein
MGLVSLLGRHQRPQDLLARQEQVTVAAPEQLGLAGGGELLGGVLPNGVEQPVADVVTSADDHDERLVHESGDEVKPSGSPSPRKRRS